MNRSEILKSFNPYLTEASEEIIDHFVDIEDRVKKQQELAERIGMIILEQQAKIKSKLELATLKVSTALFGDKKFTTETFSLNLPIQKEYFETDTISITDGILTPKRVRTSITNKRKLPYTSIVSRKETDFRIINNKIYLDKNSYFPYQELEIRLPKDTQTGFLYLLLDKFDKIAVLDKFGKEIEDTAVINSVVVPVTQETGSVVLRFTVNKPKVFSITDFYIAESSYESTTEVETKNILVNQYLTQIGINTCDNYSDPDVNIKYLVSINNEDFKEIRPLNKHKNLHLKSILSTSVSNLKYTLERAITTDLGVMYVLDDFDSTEFDITKSFKCKLGDNKGMVVNKELLTLYSESPISITLHRGQPVVLNGVTVIPDTDNYILQIPKGFSTLQVEPLFWNQREDLLRYDILSVEADRLVLSDKQSGEVLSKQILDPTKRESLSVFLQLINKVEIYTEEYEPRVVFINSTKYIAKESPNNTYIFYKNRSKLVETVKLKIQMNTNNPKIPAYVSSITIRGV